MQRTQPLNFFEARIIIHNVLTTDCVNSDVYVFALEIESKHFKQKGK